MDGFDSRRLHHFPPVNTGSIEELRARAEAGDAGGLNTERQSSQQRRTMHRCHPARYRGFKSLAGENTPQLADSESHGDTEK